MYVCLNDHIIYSFISFRACSLYISSKDLIDAVLITTADPDDQKKLQMYSDIIFDKFNSCKHRVDELQLT